MATHKYAVGERVAVLPDRVNLHMRAGVYKITRTLPETNGGCQYRVKSEMDPHERVVDEARLIPVRS